MIKKIIVIIIGLSLIGAVGYGIYMVAFTSPNSYASLNNENSDANEEINEENKEIDLNSDEEIKEEIKEPEDSNNANEEEIIIETPSYSLNNNATSNETPIYIANTANLQKALEEAREYYNLTSNDSNLNAEINNLKEIYDNASNYLGNVLQSEINAATENLLKALNSLKEKINKINKSALEAVLLSEKENTKANIDAAILKVNQMPNGSLKDEYLARCGDKTAPVISVLDQTFIIGEELYSDSILTITDNYDEDILNKKVEVQYYQIIDNTYNLINPFINGESLENYSPGEYFILYEVKDSSGNIGKKEQKITLVDKTAPVITVEKNIETFTKDSVLVTLKANEEIKELDGWTLSFDKKSLSKIYTTNIIEELIVLDLYDNATIVNLEINNIDQEKPVIAITDESKINDFYTNIILNIKDNNEIKEITINDSPYELTTFNDITLTNDLWTEGLNTIIVKDVALNEEKIEFIYSKSNLNEYLVNINNSETIYLNGIFNEEINISNQNITLIGENDTYIKKVNVLNDEISLNNLKIEEINIDESKKVSLENLEILNTLNISNLKEDALIEIKDIVLNGNESSPINIFNKQALKATVNIENVTYVYETLSNELMTLNLTNDLATYENYEINLKNIHDQDSNIVIDNLGEPFVLYTYKMFDDGIVPSDKEATINILNAE